MKGKPHESEVFFAWAALDRRGLRPVKRQSAQIFRFSFVQNAKLARLPKILVHFAQLPLKP